jgi:hypothetical protein
MNSSWREIFMNRNSKLKLRGPSGCDKSKKHGKSAPPRAMVPSMIEQSKRRVKLINEWNQP